MSESAIKAANRAVFEAMSRGDAVGATAVHAANCVYYGLGPQPTDMAGCRQFLQGYFTAFPDLTFTIEDEIEEGDTIVTRYTSRGTHNGPLMGAPATGRRIETSGISIARFAGDKTVALWNSLDTLGMLVQLGIVPAPGQAPVR